MGANMRRQNLIRIFLQVIAVYLIPHASGWAQEVKFKSILDNNRIYIGEQVNYILELTIPANYQFEWPQIYDSLAPKIEIVRKTTVDTARISGNTLRVSQVFTITSFDTGYYLIPPVALKYRTGTYENEMKLIETEPFVLNVHSIPVDITQPIKPIKGPISVPITFREILPWILVALLLAGVVYLIVKRKRKPIPVVVSRQIPNIPPHLWALEELENLRKEKLWQQGLIKEYHSRLSWIIRMYLENQFSIPAVESATSEILQMIPKVLPDHQAGEMLREILSLADLVKFARAQPLPSENDNSMELAEKFVKSTSIKNVSEGLSQTATSSQVISENSTNDNPVY